MGAIVDLIFSKSNSSPSLFHPNRNWMAMALSREKHILYLTFARSRELHNYTPLHTSQNSEGMVSIIINFAPLPISLPLPPNFSLSKCHSTRLQSLARPSNKYTKLNIHTHHIHISHLHVLSRIVLNLNFFIFIIIYYDTQAWYEKPKPKNILYEPNVEFILTMK
jgi:hypothetical protein